MGSNAFKFLNNESQTQTVIISPINWDLMSHTLHVCMSLVMSYIHVCMTLSGMWPVMYTWGPTTISGVLISAPGVLMDNDNDNHLFLHLSPESKSILSAQKWQKSLMKPKGG